MNGRPYESPWVKWRDLEKGSTLAFNLEIKPSKWGSAPQQAPPSFDGLP
jgi:putative alpha-1,2-mannosidase